MHAFFFLAFLPFALAHTPQNAVLSHDYWTHRFGQDPKIIGRTFQMGAQLYEIVGVTRGEFSGTEPGIVTDIFLPTMMNEGVTHSDWSWARIFAQLKPEIPAGPLSEKLQTNFRTFQTERSKEFTSLPKQKIQNFLNQKIVLEPAASGVSDMPWHIPRSCAGQAAHERIHWARPT